MSNAAETSADARPDISLVIPAFNEAAYLPRLLDTVDVARAQFRRGPDRIEVIVADNDSTDATPLIAADRGVRVEHVARRVIAAARNGGAAVATGRIVAFADADFRIHPQTFNNIDTVMSAGRYIGGATGLTMERWSLGISATWYLMMPVLSLFSMDGGVWFCRRSDFLEVGGFDDSRHFGEDVVFLTRLKRLGARRRPKEKLATRHTADKRGIAPALVINSSRKWDKHGEWHMVRDMARAPFYFLFGRSKLDNYAREYWYNDRAEGDA